MSSQFPPQNFTIKEEIKEVYKMHTFAGIIEKDVRKNPDHKTVLQIIWFQYQVERLFEWSKQIFQIL